MAVQRDPETIRPGNFIGSASECIADIQRWRSQGIPYTHLCTWGTRPGVSIAAMTPYLERFARDVIPAFALPRQGY